MMNKLRWEIAKALNHLVWFICPEPQKSKIRKDWMTAHNTTLAKKKYIAHRSKSVAKSIAENFNKAVEP